MRSFYINAKSGSSEIVISPNLDLTEHVDPDTVMLLDEVVYRLYAGKFSSFRCHAIKCGEENKNLNSLENIYDILLNEGLNKDDSFASAGGGSLTDLAGFAGATYKRGLSFIFIPTTLMAMVDASIGGKNGFNFKGIKNAVGTIRQPEKVIYSLDFLDTLNEDLFLDGICESIKMGVGTSEKLFDYLENNVDAIKSRDKEKLEELIYLSVFAKGEIITADEQDKGKRHILNLGHTLGHSLESASNNDISHGRAVIAGLIFACALSIKNNLLSESNFERIKNIINNFNIKLNIEANKDKIISALRHDKKRTDDKINMILPISIGEAAIQKVKITELIEALNDLSEY